MATLGIIGIDSLPNDILREILINYVVGFSGSKAIFKATPLMILVLSLVCKRFYHMLATTKTPTYMAMENYMNLPFHCREEVTGRRLYEAARDYGSISLIDWFTKLNYISLSAIKIIAAAAEGGHIPLLNCLRNQGLFWAISSTDLDNLEVLENIEILETALVASGKVDMLLWAEEHLGNWYRPSCLLTAAVRAGRLDFVRYLAERDNLLLIPQMHLCRAVESNNTELVKYLLGRASELHLEDKLHYTVTSGSMSRSMAQLVHETYGAWPLRNVNILGYAASVGNLELLRYYHEKGLTLAEPVAVNALRYGHVHVLRWLAQLGGAISVTPASLVSLLDSQTNILETLEFLHGYSGESLRAALTKCAKHFDVFLPAPVWKFLASVGVEPASVCIIRALQWTSTPEGLKTARFFFEDLEKPFPVTLARYKLHRAKLRLDVLAYLKEKNFFW